MDTESEPKEAPSETEELQPLPARTTLPSSDHTPTSPNPTLVLPLTDEEFEASEPLDTKITDPVIWERDMMLTGDCKSIRGVEVLLTVPYGQKISESGDWTARTQLAMSPGLSARVTNAMTLSPSSFRKRHKSSYETPSSSLSLASSPTLPVRKRERERERDELEDEGPNSEGEEAEPEGQQQQAASIEVTIVDRPLGIRYGAARRRALELAKEVAPSSLEIGQSSRSREVREEIHSQRFMLRSLERAQERAIITFGALWRLVLALEAWAGHTNAHQAAMWQAKYEDHRLIHDLLVKNATIQRLLQEMRDRVTTLE
ncbi:hypothetical protein Tco_0874101 [Tanacetum coccineum]|uniref:Uncharacterized protein n=1 Tax=Tanacetum coccineum TaxID=301880 RepID=A0ABQ5BKR5_9ASTR